MEMIQSVAQDLFRVDGVLGIIVFSSDEKIIFQDLSQLNMAGFPVDGLDIMRSLFHDVKEADFLYGSYRITIRGYSSGHIWVIMRPDASAAMVRLQCDVLTPKLEEVKPKKKGIGRFFT